MMAHLSLSLDLMLLYHAISFFVLQTDGKTTTAPATNTTGKPGGIHITTNWELMFAALTVATAIFIVLLCTKRLPCCSKACRELQATNGRVAGPATTTERPVVTVSAMISDLSPPKYEDCIIEKLPRYDELFDENGVRRQSVSDKT